MTRKPDPLRERAELTSLIKGFPKSSKQINSIFESDTEILKLAKDRYLVTSTDAIADEISFKLYEEPFTWGWMCVMSSVSDLSASGANGLGLLLSTQWGFGTQTAEKREFYRGAKAALKKVGLPLLGGDSGSSHDSVLGSTIFGECRQQPLMRIPMRAGDIIAIQGRGQTGIGPTLAYKILLGLANDEMPERFFRPAPQPQVIAAIRPHLRGAIDTSDGIACALAILATLNNIGFELAWNKKLIHPKALAFCRRNRVPAPMIWMSDHGDFQTLVAIPEKNESLLQRSPELIPIGRVSKRKGFRLQKDGQQIDLPVFDVTNVGRDLDALKALTGDLIRYFA